MTLQDLLVLAAGFFLKVILDLFSGAILDKWREMIVSRARGRYKVDAPLLPDIYFQSYKIGKIEVPVMPILGSPSSPFRMEEVNIHYSPVIFEDQSTYPKDLRAARAFLIEEISKQYRLKGLVDNILPRLDNIVQAPETENDQRGHLDIFLSLTRYKTMLATGGALEHRIIPESGVISQFTKNKTIRQTYCKPPYADLSQSILGNAPGVEVVVVSSSPHQQPERQVIVRKRSQQVAFFKGWHQTSASGHMSLEHKDPKGHPNPFVTAVSEAKQEIADSLDVAPEQFKLIGVLLKWQDLHPAFYGYLETDIPVKDLIGDFRRDAFEGGLFAMPFTPQEVLTHIATEQWFPISAVAMISTLLAFYPRSELDSVARTLPERRVTSFLLESTK